MKGATWHLPREAEEEHKNSFHIHQIFGSRFEPGKFKSMQKCHPLERNITLFYEYVVQPTCFLRQFSSSCAFTTQKGRQIRTVTEIFKDTNRKPVHKPKNTKCSLKQSIAPNKTKTRQTQAKSNKILQFTHQLPSATKLRKPHNPKSYTFIHQNAATAGQGMNLLLP